MRGDGTEIRDFIYAEDVARGLVQIAEHGVAGTIYNIGSNEPVSLLELGRIIVEAIGLPADAVTPDGQVEAGQVQLFYPDVTRLFALGFEPKWSLTEGIRQTLEWIRSDG